MNALDHIRTIASAAWEVLYFLWHSRMLLRHCGNCKHFGNSEFFPRCCLNHHATTFGDYCLDWEATC